MKTVSRLVLASTLFCLSPSTIKADPLDLWYTRNSGATNVLNANAVGNGTCVAVGNEGTILSSTNGVIWTRRSSGTTAVLNSMVFAGNLFVAVGGLGTILTSTNGTSWTRRTSGTTDFLYDVSYGAGKFIAVSDTGTVVTSANGVNWSPRNAGTPSVFGVAYGNGKFVSVGGYTLCNFPFCNNYSVAYSSANGVIWTQVLPGPGVYLSDLAFGNGLFVAVGEAGTILTSTDGVSWSPQASGSGDFLLNIAFGDGTFVVVGSQQGSILTSKDGVNWTPRNSGTSTGLFNVAHGDSKFVVVGNSGTILQSSYSGPPRLSTPRLLGDGTVEIPVAGEMNQTYRLQGTTNSVAWDWMDLVDFTQTDEVQNVVDSEAANFSSRLYRVILP